MRRYDPCDLVTDDTRGASLDELCDGTVDGVQKRLNALAVIVDSDSAVDDPDLSIPEEIWNSGNAEIHTVCRRGP